MNTNRVSVYTEPERQTPVIADYDVVVVGGGPAGCAAALAAARDGARVALLEREGFLGGAPATMFVTSILSTNGVDFLGLWHDFIRELKLLGGVTGLVHHPKPLAEYILSGFLDPEAVKYAWDRLLSGAGVSVMHYCTVCGTMMEGTAASGVIFESVGGRQAVSARRVIDASGDAIVCHHAGAAWDQGNGSEKYAMAFSMVSYFGGVSSGGTATDDPDEHAVETALAELFRDRDPGDTEITARQLLRFGGADGRRVRPHDRQSGPGKFLYEVDPLDHADLTRGIREGRRYLWDFARALSTCVPRQRNAYVQATPNSIGIRSGRRVHGRARVTERDVWEFAKYPDSVARVSWDVDIYNPHRYEGWSVPRHTPEYQKHIERLKEGEYFDIPYGCIVVKDVDNLFVAGRCISAEHVAQSTLRIQQTCMATGEAAGIAAAMSLRDDVSPSDLDTRRLVGRLAEVRDGVEPAFEELIGLPVARGYEAASHT